MRRWLALALLVIAGALAWVLRDGSRGVAATRTVEPSGDALEARTGGPEGVEPTPDEPEPEARRTAAAPVIDLAAAPREQEPPPNVLDVRVLAADGTAWDDGALRIRAAHSPILREQRPMFSPGGDGSEGEPWMARIQVWEIPTDEGVYTQYRTDAEGRVRILGVTPGQPFTLLAVDAVGCAGARRDEPPMRLGEERSVELRLSSFAVPLLGLCRAADGRAQAEAEILVRGGPEILNLRTDERGAFATAPLFARRLLVQARHPEHGLAMLVDVDPSLGTIVLTLRATRTLSVRLVGERGGRPSTSWMRLRLAPEGAYVTGHPAVRDDLYVFERIPRDPLTLVIEHPAPMRSLAVDATVESLTWVVPEQGELELGLGHLPERVDGEYALEFHSLDEPAAQADVWPLHTTETQNVRQTLWAGRYALQVLFVPSAAPDRPVPWGASVEVEIRGGETMHATLGS